MQNAEEARKCLALAKKKFAEGDVDGAVRMAKKAKRIDSTLNVEALLSKWTVEEEVETPLTDKQIEIMNRITRIDSTDFYAIMDLDKNCSETDIKKSYRKLALHLHPDKCADPRAKEAFLKVSKAFSILSDSEKRRIFDMSGKDPDDRTSHYSQFQRSQHMRDSFNMDDILAEQIFAQFFGMHANQFQSFNSPHMRRRTRNFHHTPDATRQDRGRAQDNSIFRLLVQCAPLILFVVLSVLPTLLRVRNPNVSLNPVSGFAKYTTPLQFNYYAAHYDMNRFRNQGGNIRQFEAELDQEIVGKYRQRCKNEMEYKMTQISLASNTWFGLKAVDEKAIQRAKEIKTPSCSELDKRGINR
eukprot:NODE_2_length_91304_cov_0.692462.p28 type:complete len:356 gc:universal NODE_2_length_91304_cov_0.692462:41187-40120(-)